MRRIRVDSLAVAAIGLSGQALVFLLHIVLTRSLGTFEYGLVMIQMAWASSLLIPATAGQERTALRTVPRLVDQGVEHLGGYLRFATIAVTTCSVIVAIAYVSLSRLIPGIREQDISLAIVTAVFLVGTALFLRSAGILRGLNEPKLPQFAESLLRPLLVLVAFLALVFALQSRPDALTALVAFAVAPWLLQLFTAFRVRARLRALAGSGTARPYRASRSDMLEWTRLGISLALGAAALALMYTVDIIMLGALADPESAALYGVASRLSLLMLFGMNAVQIVVSPPLSSAHARGELTVVRRLVNIAALFGFGISAAIAVLFLAAGGQLLAVFGAEFVGANSALRILVLGQLLNAATGITGTYMSMTCDPRILLAFITGGLAINIALNLWLIPLLGIEGAAIASIVSHASWNLCAFVYVWRSHRIDLSIFSAGLQLLKPRV